MPISRLFSFSSPPSTLAGAWLLQSLYTQGWVALWWWGGEAHIFFSSQIPFPAMAHRRAPQKNNEEEPPPPPQSPLAPLRARQL